LLWARVVTNFERRALNGETDDALEQRWRGGDLAAGNQLFDRYRRRLRRFFERRAGEQTDDLVQQTIAAALSGHRRLEKPVTFGAYLFGTARFHLTGYLRQRRRETSRYASVELEELPLLATRSQEHSNAAAIAEAALAELALEFRSIVTMACLEQQTAPQIALTTNLPLATVYSRLRRGKQKLRVAYARLVEK
jgi:RNA polymerase sigma-70 factor (ECF subfamily)